MAACHDKLKIWKSQVEQNSDTMIVNLDENFCSSFLITKTVSLQYFFVIIYRKCMIIDVSEDES